MAVTREEAFEALASLQPAAVFLESYQTERLPENLDIYFHPPEEFFIAPETQELYTQNRLIPILDDGNFGTVTFLDPETRQIIQLSVESPGEIRESFRHWNQYLADLMIRIGESVDDDEQVRRMAGLVGFAQIDALFAYFERARGDAWAEVRRQFLLEIPE